MSIGDPVCPHQKWLANCGTCVGWRNAGKDPYKMFEETRTIHWLYSVGDESPIGVIIDGKLSMTKKNHKPELDPAVLAEHQAKIEWEERTQTVADLKKAFLSLPIELRREVLTDICMYCLRESRGPCHCNNDE